MKRGEWARQIAFWVYDRLRRSRGLLAKANRRAGVGPHYFRQAADYGTIDLHVLHHLEGLLGLKVDEMIRAAHSKTGGDDAEARPTADDAKARWALESEVEALELLCRRDPEQAFEAATQALEQATSPGPRRARLLGCLAAAHRSQGLPGGLKHLVEALGLTTDPRALAELHARRALAFLDRGDLVLADLACQAALDHALGDGLDTVGRAYVVNGVVAYHRDRAQKAERAWTLAIKTLDGRVPGGQRFKHSAYVARGIARIELGDVVGAEGDLRASRERWKSPHDESLRLAARVTSARGRWCEAAEAQRWVVQQTHSPLAKAAEALALIEWQLRAGDSEGAANTVAIMAGLIETAEVNEYAEAVICGLVQANFESRLDLGTVEAARRQLDEISRRARAHHEPVRSSRRRYR